MRSFATVLLVTIVATGCATAPVKVEISSKRAASAPAELKRIFVVSHVRNTGDHPNFGLPFEQALESRLSEQLKRCGAATAGISMDGLDLGDELDEALGDFKPDAVLTVRRVHVFLYEGQISREIYEVTLLGPSASKRDDDLKTWWVARAVHRAGVRQWDPLARFAGFEVFVDGIFGQMKTDGFFPGCAAPGPGELPPSARQVVLATAYAPSTKVRATGSLGIGEVGYASMRARVKQQDSDAARDRAFGTVVVNPQAEDLSVERLRGRTPASAGVTRFSPDLGAYFREAIVRELGAMGIGTADGRRLLRGEIEEATVDFEGWGVSASLRARWELVDAAGKVLFSAVKTTSTPQQRRPMSEREAFDLVLRLNAEALAEDPQFAEAIR